MRSPVRIRLLALFLILCLLWSVSGAPLNRAEWRALPQTLRYVLARLPLGMQSVWRAGPLLRQTEAAVPLGGIPVRVWDTQLGRALLLPLEDYVAGVVSAEMPARYAPAALQCQAVAARTRAAWSLLSLGGRGCASHPDCDVCTSSACCQGYLSTAQARLRWGGESEVCLERVRLAAKATRGLILTWEGKPIESVYHACSGGKTEAASAVFANDLPYLVSVDSPGEEHHAQFASTQRFSLKEAAARLTLAFPDCGVTAQSLPEALRLQSTTASGRVGTVLAGETLITGMQLRQALDLRSTLCTWSAEDGELVFSLRGYGHGVGMSQAGAQAMAARGYAFSDILAHYYPGTTLGMLISAQDDAASQTPSGG